MSDEEIVFTGKTEAIYKVLVIGDPSVGKTSLLDNFSSKKFKSQYIPTVGVNILKEIIELDEGIINLMIWDIAGQPQFYMNSYFNKKVFLTSNFDSFCFSLAIK